MGKVYGRHLALGGAQISFWVKEKYAESARQGFHFYVLNETTKRDEAQALKDYSVLTEVNEVKSKTWDYVILCMASNALRGPWLDELIGAIGNASLVSLQPGLNDRDYLLTKVSRDRLIEGTIPIISYETPMPGEQRTIPGTAYWIPPGGYAAFSGSSERVLPLLEVFQRGKFKVKRVKDTKHENVAAAPVLTLFIAALEACDWSFQKLYQSPLFAEASQAMQEAVAANALKAGVKKPSTWHLRPALFKSILSAAPFIVPFNLETYLKVHFTKVGEQMHQSLRDYVEFAKAKNLPSQHLSSFSAKLQNQ